VTQTYSKGNANTLNDGTDDGTGGSAVTAQWRSGEVWHCGQVQDSPLTFAGRGRGLARTQPGSGDEISTFGLQTCPFRSKF